MDVQKILALLREERTRIEDAILHLEILENGSTRRRGRPPKWLMEARRRSQATGSLGPEGDQGMDD